MSALLALDPGLDECGFAVLAIAPVLPRAMRINLPQLDAVGTWYCPPGDTLDARLARHAERLEEVVMRAAATDRSIRHAVIERPVTSTVYAAHRRGGPTQQTKMARSREAQENVTGALWMWCHVHGITAHYAAPAGKKFRALEHLTFVYPDLPRTSEHARAALALGLAALSDHRRTWAA